VIDLGAYEVLSFDCYGTLIDWERGILTALRPVFSRRRIRLGDDRVLELYATFESAAERGAYVTYRQILREVMRRFGAELRFTPTRSELNLLVESLRGWAPFPDTVEALRILKRHVKLAVISNIDDDLFAVTAGRLGVRFDWVITAEQAKSYKPSLNNFRMAIDRFGVPPRRVLHVAQSLYHDIIPAQRFGLSTVWVNRSQGREGFGATPRARARADLEVPDLTRLVAMMGLGRC
jgi:2-haloacid dehalogenase